MNTSEISGCLFRGKADICEEFNCQRKDPLSPAKQSNADVPEAKTMKGVNTNNRNMDKKMAATPSSFLVSQDIYKTLLENLYTARLCLLRARNITMNQLGVYEEEAINHMQEIKRITKEELDKPQASAELLAQGLVKVSTEVVRKQQALNRMEMEELVKNLDNLLNTLKADVKEAKSLAESEYEENKQKSYVDSIFDYGHRCLFILYASVALITWLFYCLPAFEES